MSKENKSLSRIFHDALNEKCIEPIKRKHGNFVEEWQRHRFPIKNGISSHESFLRDMREPNTLWEKVLDKALKEK